MKRYLVFGWYHALGGFDDFLVSYDNINSARSYISRNKDIYLFMQIIDIETGNIINYDTGLQHKPEKHKMGKFSNNKSNKSGLSINIRGMQKNKN
jgi:hypothetical protein